MKLYLFNSRTGQVKKISKTMVFRNKEWEYLFENKNDITLEVRKKLMNQTRVDDEVFIKLPGSDHYFVSNYGRVKKIFPKSKKEKILIPYEHKRDKVLLVKVRVDHTYKQVRLTHLVARCFKIAGEGEFIIHVNKNIWDNSVSNLKYVKQKDLIKIPQRLQRNAVVKLHPETLEELEYYPSIREAGRCEFLSHESIRSCLKGKQKTAGGFKWIYDRA